MRRLMPELRLTCTFWKGEKKMWWICIPFPFNSLVIISSTLLCNCIFNIISNLFLCLPTKILLLWSKVLVIPHTSRMIFVSLFSLVLARKWTCVGNVLKNDHVPGLANIKKQCNQRLATWPLVFFFKPDLCSHDLFTLPITVLVYFLDSLCLLLLCSTD